MIFRHSAAARQSRCSSDSVSDARRQDAWRCSISADSGAMGCVEVDNNNVMGAKEDGAGRWKWGEGRAGSL